MVDLPETVAVIACFAAVAVMVAAPVCWFVVRTGSSRTSGNARQIAGRIRLMANVLLGTSGLAIVASAATVAFLVYIQEDSGSDVAVAIAVILISILFGLIAVAFRNAAASVGRLVDDADDDTQMTIDRRLGGIAFIGWLGVTLLLLVVLLVIPFTLVFFLLILFIAVPLTLQLVRARRQCQLLWLMTVTIRSGRNLPDELRNHASSSYGANAANIRQLAQDLESGLPLGDALLANRVKSIHGPVPWQLFVKYNPLSLLGRYFFGPGVILPAWVTASIQTAEKTGTLEKTLAVCSKQYLDSIRTRFTLSNVSGLLAYLLAYASIGTGIFGFLMVFIIPKFKAIFEGFGTELPRMTELVIGLADFMVDYWYVGVLLGVVPFRLLVRLGIGEPQAVKNLDSRLLAKLLPKFDAPDVLRQMSAVIQSGKPVTAALDAIARSHQRRSTRKALSEVFLAVDAGGDCWELLSKAGYIRSQDLQLIRVATEAGNLPWALDELADSRERAHEHRMHVTTSFVEPLVVMAFGLVCAFIIIGLFMPLVKLVNDLS